MAGIYLDLHFDPNWAGCSTAGAWVTPIGVSQSPQGFSYLAHDCCSATELEYVLANFERDIEAIRQKAKRLFADDLAQKAPGKPTI
jgi:hypothetical protein